VKIGVVGIGKMGAAIATRLLGLGHEVVVWNRSAEKAKAVSGAKVAATPRELASDVETIISILTNAAAIDGSLRRRRWTLEGRHPRQALHRDEHCAAAD
jgi:3-hydroxyisobutyrate dehydrogenase